MTINPAKALAAERVMKKLGIPPKQESKPREYMSKDDAKAIIERLKRKPIYKSKIGYQGSIDV